MAAAALGRRTAGHVSTAPHLALGRAAEAAAARHLERLGFTIVAANFRGKGGELDLVALDGHVLAIVEVRYRASDRYGGAAASITHGKRSRIIRAARALLATNPPLAKLPARFDVVEVTGPVDNLRCAVIRGAFSL
jgi:putative endonuclease